MNNSEDTIYFKNLDSKFILNSQAHANQLGEADVRDMVGKDDFSYFPEEFARAAYADEQKIIRTGKPLIGHVERWQRPDGSVVWLSACKYPLYDETGQIIGTWGTSRDVTPLKEAEEKLRELNRQLQDANDRLAQLSIRDSLSGLYNHRHFIDSLELAKAQESRLNESESGGAFSLLLLDVDQFKQINDTYGHLTGDSVILTVGEQLQQSTRSSDLCFRNGGDEFALILTATDLHPARTLAEKLCRVVRDTPLRTDNVTFHVTVSIGVACSSEAETVRELIGLADKRLYQSKRAGRNQVS